MVTNNHKCSSLVVMSGHMNHFQSGRLYNTLNDIDGLHGGMFRSTGTMTPWVFRGSSGSSAPKAAYSQYILQNTRGRSPRRRTQVLLPQSTPSAWDSTLITKYNYDDNYVRLKRIQSLRAEIIDSGRGIYISDGELQRFIQGVNEQEVSRVATVEDLLQYFRPCQPSLSEQRVASAASQSAKRSQHHSRSRAGAVSPFQALRNEAHFLAPAMSGPPVDMTKSLGCQLAEGQHSMQATCRRVFGASQPIYSPFVMKATYGEAPGREVQPGLFPTVRGTIAKYDSRLISKHSGIVLA